MGFFSKLRLWLKIRRNAHKIPSATSWYEQLLLVKTILNIPRFQEGVLVECGCFKGASTASLSLAAQIVGRKLFVFDSFAGLPAPDEIDQAHHCPHRSEIHTYTKGTYYARLEEVKENIKKYGASAVCEFIPGYFEETLPHFTHKVVFIFLDVDLRRSMETCLRYLWGLLQDNGVLFTHEAQHLEIAELFFDQKWWQENLGTRAPGLIGAGCGLAFNLKFGSNLGYIKKSIASTWKVCPQNKK